MERRVISTESFVEDEKLENSLRPMKLEEYIGQERVKSNLKVYIEAARNRKDVLDHVLTSGTWQDDTCKYYFQRDGNES